MGSAAAVRFMPCKKRGLSPLRRVAQSPQHLFTSWSHSPHNWARNRGRVTERYGLLTSVIQLRVTVLPHSSYD